MKKILIIALFAVCTTLAYSQVSIGELTSVSSKSGTDQFVVEQSDSTRKISLTQLFTNVTLAGTLTMPSPFTLGSTSVTTSGTQFNYINSATGTTGTTTSNLVFSENPVFTGVQKVSTTDTLATKAYARSVSGGGSMSWPGDGIAVASSSSWATSITNSSGLASALSDEVGSNYVVFNNNSTLTGSTTADNIQTDILQVGAGGNTFGIDSITTDGNNVRIYDGVNQLVWDDPDASEVDIDTVAYILTDTIPLYGAVLGVGNTNDTAAFAVDNVIWGQYIDGSHNIVITEVRAVVAGTSPDVDVALLYDPNYKDGTPTTVLSSDLTVTSTTAGNSTTSFSNATIAPGNWLWLRVDQATAKPTQLVLSIFGYRTETE